MTKNKPHIKTQKKKHAPTEKKTQKRQHNTKSSRREKTQKTISNQNVRHNNHGHNRNQNLE